MVSSDEMPFEVDRGLLSERIYALVKSMIKDSTLQPGEQVVEVQLARRLGVSQAPVREALKRLIHEGLITSTRHRGSFVAEFTRREGDDARVARVGLESMAARLAWHRIDSATRELLVSIIDRMHAAADREDLAAFRELDFMFHKAVIVRSGNVHLPRVWDLLEPSLRSLHIAADHTWPGDWHDAADTHRELLNALDGDDADVAVEVFSAHAQRMASHLTATLAEPDDDRETATTSDRADATGSLPPSLFKPPASASLKLWLKADMGITADAAGHVSTWADQSASASSAVQENVHFQPTIVADAVNGLPVVRFDGIDDQLLAAGVSGDMSAFTMIVVLKPSSVASYNQSIAAGGGWGEFAFHTTSSGQVYAGTTKSSRITPADGPGVNTMIPDTWHNFAYVANNGVATLFKNGALLASKAVTDPPPWTGFQLGKNNSGTVHGDVAEVLIYKTALSDTDRQSIDAYLQSKYGL